MEEALGRHQRMFLRGAAGSGKTTLLRWVGVRASREDFPDPMAAWHGQVPFLVPLRQYVGQPLPESADFVRHTGRHLAEQAPQGWVTGLMERGRTVLLVDGVDELHQGQREDARRWLRDLISGFPACRYVVTTRPGAASEDWSGADGFVSAELQPRGRFTRLSAKPDRTPLTHCPSPPAWEHRVLITRIPELHTLTFNENQKLTTPS